jgi:hypothetical protein
MVVMVWLLSGGLFCERLAGVVFCAFLEVLEVPVLAGLMLLSQDLIKRQAYLNLVRPHLEYASSVWDPHLQKHIPNRNGTKKGSAVYQARIYCS